MTGRHKAQPTISERILEASGENDARLVHILIMVDSIENGNQDNLKQCLELANAFPNHDPGDDVWRPLHLAARLGDSAAVRLLLKHGAKSTLLNGPTRTNALQEPARGLSPSCVRLLAARGAKPTGDTYTQMVMDARDDPESAERCLDLIMEHNDVSGEIAREATARAIEMDQEAMLTRLTMNGAEIGDAALRNAATANPRILQTVLASEERVARIKKLIKTEERPGTYLANAALTATDENLTAVLAALKPTAGQMWQGLPGDDGPAIIREGRRRPEEPDTSVDGALRPVRGRARSRLTAADEGGAVRRKRRTRILHGRDRPRTSRTNRPPCAGQSAQRTRAASRP